LRAEEIPLSDRSEEITSANAVQCTRSLSTPTEEPCYDARNQGRKKEKGMNPIVISMIIAAASFTLTILSAIYLNQRHVDKLVEQLEKRFEACITGLAQTMEAHVTGLKQTIQTMDARITRLEQNTNARFEKMEQIMNARFDKMEQIMNARFHAVEARLDRIEQIAF
jgi:predicted secreted Zn-dependent protease